MAISALALYTYTIIYIFNYDMEEIFENFIILVIYSPFFRYFWYQLGDYLYWLELNSLIVICNDIKKLKSPYLSFGLYCICTNFEDTLGMILLSPFIFVSLRLYAYLFFGLFIWIFMSLAMDDFYKEWWKVRKGFFLFSLNKCLDSPCQHLFFKTFSNRLPALQFFFRYLIE